MSKDNPKSRAGFQRRVDALQKRRMKALMDTIKKDDLGNSFIALANYWQTSFIAEDVSYALAGGAGTYGAHAATTGELNRSRHSARLLEILDRSFSRRVAEYDAELPDVNDRRH